MLGRRLQIVLPTVVALLCLIAAWLGLSFILTPYGEYSLDGDTVCRIRSALLWNSKQNTSQPPGFLDWLPLPFYTHLFFWKIGIPLLTAAQILPWLLSLMGLLFLVRFWQLSFSQSWVAILPALLLASNYHFVKASYLPLTDAACAGLVMTFIYMLLRRWWILSAVIISAAGLIRYEAWGVAMIAFLYLAYIRLRKPENFDFQAKETPIYIFPLLLLTPVSVMIWSHQLANTAIHGFTESMNYFALFSEFKQFNGVDRILFGLIEMNYLPPILILLIGVWSAILHPRALLSWVNLGILISFLSLSLFFDLLMLPRYYLINIVLSIASLPLLIKNHPKALKFTFIGFILIIGFQLYSFQERAKIVIAERTWPPSIAQKIQSEFPNISAIAYSIRESVDECQFQIEYPGIFSLSNFNYQHIPRVYRQQGYTPKSAFEKWLKHQRKTVLLLQGKSESALNHDDGIDFGRYGEKHFEDEDYILYLVRRGE